MLRIRITPLLRWLYENRALLDEMGVRPLLDDTVGDVAARLLQALVEERQHRVDVHDRNRAKFYRLRDAARALRAEVEGLQARAEICLSKAQQALTALHAARNENAKLRAEVAILRAENALLRPMAQQLLREKLRGFLKGRPFGTAAHGAK